MMTETFIHHFGSWEAAEARRWKNADGSPGGIVALTAIIDPSARIAETAEVGPEANIGVAIIAKDAIIGVGARIGRGAWIADGARIGDGARIDTGVNIDWNAHIGSGAHIGSYAQIGDGVIIGCDVSISSGVLYEHGDWLYVAGPQGSRNAYATAVWSPQHGLRWWVGCQRGISTEELLARIQQDHGDNSHGDDYRYLIQMVTNHPDLMRAMEAKS